MERERVLSTTLPPIHTPLFRKNELLEIITAIKYHKTVNYHKNGFLQKEEHTVLGIIIFIIILLIALIIVATVLE